MNTWAIIPSRDRFDLLLDLVHQLLRHNVRPVVIDNGYEGDERRRLAWLSAALIRFDGEPNLSRMWNLGFELIGERERSAGAETWNVVVFNDDTVVPAPWFDYVAAGLRANDVAVACTDPYGSLIQALIKRQPDGNIATRMCPWAFMVRGELDLRADENMAWWWGDTDFDWQACGAGGVLLLPGCTAQNTLANSTTFGRLAEQAGRDGEAFVRKWGWRPW